MVLFVIGHPSTSSAESVGLGVSFTEGGCASALNMSIITISC